MSLFYVYMLQSSRNRHYIGYTSNLSQRIAQHNRKHKGFTGTSEIWEIKCYAEFANKIEAMAFEKKLKELKNFRLAEKYINEKHG